MPIQILVVEDDVHISGLLCELLTRGGYVPTPAFSGTEAELRLSQASFALVLLDLMLPGKTGLDVLRGLREHSDTPVITLTAVSGKESTVALLKAGADDYVTKPFDNAELLARIEACLRRQAISTTPSSALTYKDIVIDDDLFDAVIRSERAELSKREFDILKLLMSHPNKVFTKDNIYASVWGEEFFGDDNTINVHISKLRAKLARLNPNEEYVQTVWGIGFKMA
jgi:DNA-binding response OmpR family regulator